MARFSGLPSAEELRELKWREIVKCASRMFAKHGYKGTSLAAIAAELGVTKTAIYYYVKNKRVLLYECHKLGLRQALAALEEATSRDAPPLAQLHRTLCAYLIAINGGGMQYIMFDAANELSRSQAAEIQDMRDQFEKGIRDLVRACIKNGSMRASTDPKLAGFILLGSVNWVSRWYRQDGPWSLEEIADRIPRETLAAFVTDPAQLKPIRPGAPDARS